MKPKITFLITSFSWCVFGYLNEDLSFHRHFPLFKYRLAKSELDRIKLESVFVSPYQKARIRYKKSKLPRPPLNVMM